MKKTFVFILLFAVCGTLFASDLFLSPSRLAGAVIDNPFTVRVEGELGVDAVKFLADPLALDTYSESSVRVLLEKDLDFWKANPDVVSAFSEFDATFPGFSGNDELDKAMIDSYLKNTFLSEGYGRDRRSFVLASLAGTGVLSPVRGPSEPVFSFSMKGERFWGEFGWRWFFSAGFDGTSSLFSEENGELLIRGGATLAYGKAVNDKLSFGISLTPQALVRNTVLNSSMLNGRLNADFISLFTEDFRFGFSLSVNTGLTYRLSDDFSLTLDMRDFPSSSSYVRWKLTDMAAFDFKFQGENSVGAGVPDFALTGVWKDELNMVSVSARLGKTDLWNIFDFTYERALGGASSLSISLAERNIGLSYSAGGFEAGITCGLDRLRFGAFFSASV